jgi:segregation and condensation protein B
MSDSTSTENTTPPRAPEMGERPVPASISNGSEGIEKIIANLPAYLEALLFVAPGEVNPAQLASALGLAEAQVERGLDELASFYRQQRGGLRLQRLGGRVQLTTAPEMAAFVEAFLGLEATSRLSRAALETLAIVLYRQPVTRPQVESIRGVNSDGVMRSLLLKGLIQEIGRAEAPGRPILYSATADCLQYFGLSSLSELPPLNLDEPGAAQAGAETKD